MATLTKERNRVAYTISGNSPETREGVESASKTFKRGCVLNLSASGRLVPVTGTGQPSKPDFGVRGVAGWALADAGNNTNSTTKVKFLVANDDTVMLSNIASRFSTATASLSQSYVGTVCAGSFTNSGMFVSVRMVAATNSICTVRGIYEQDAIGDVFGRVYWMFNKAVRAFK